MVHTSGRGFQVRMPRWLWRIQHNPRAMSRLPKLSGAKMQEYRRIHWRTRTMPVVLNRRVNDTNDTPYFL